MKEIRVALIGFGRSGRDIHADCLKNMEQYKIVAAVELDADRREMMRNELGLEPYSHFTQLYDRDDIDLVVNASYSHMHVPITKALLEKGFNVLCEKPLAKTADEVRMLIDAQKNGGRLMIFQQSRFAPYFRQVQEVIASGVLGRIIQISIAFNGYARRWDWQCIQDMNGGSLYNTGPHPTDQALRLLDCEGMPEVRCYMDRANTFGDAEDYVKLLMSAPGRPVIDLEISSCSAFPKATYEVQGTRGGLKGTTSHLDWRYFKQEEAPPQKLQVPSLHGEGHIPLYCGESLVWYEESWDTPADGLFESMARAFYGMLYGVMREGERLEVTPEQVLQQIMVMEECHKQAPLSRMQVEGIPQP